MIIRLATDEEIAQWDDLLARNPDGGNVFQSVEVANTKRLNGWLPRYIVADERLYITVLEKHTLPFGRYWYMIKGPGVGSFTELIDFLPGLTQFAKTQGVFAIKLEPEIAESDEAHAALSAAGLVHTPAVQPNSSTVVLDLSSDLEIVMKELNQKGRHAIHRAERDGVVARAVEVNDENMRIMYDLLASTAAGRFESSLRSYEYYQAFWRSFAETGHGSLFFAYVGDQVVASAYCMYLGYKGLYKDGASVRERVAYGASHLLQWEVIKWMKEHGVTSYDFCGAPHSSRINDETHPLYGVGRFKTSFNKSVTDYIGCYDIPVNPSKYKLWQKFGQRVAVSLTYRLKHRQWF
ncbi:MAG: peptidoglycan bridge formation glycyltransferase FemA/FemB family protein [Candidatus Saccharimonas sp.]